MLGADNGSSKVLSPGGDETGCILRVGKDLLPRDAGVATDTYEGEELIDPSKDGMISLETVREDITDSAPVSLPAVSSSSPSSEAPRRKSNGPFPRETLNSFSETEESFRIESTVSRCCAREDFRRLLLFDLGGGIAVMARSAATEGEMPS